MEMASSRFSMIYKHHSSIDDLRFSAKLGPKHRENNTLVYFLDPLVHKGLITTPKVAQQVKYRGGGFKKGENNFVDENM